ncbi:MAG: hypothetical protein ACRDY1_12760 [Acidimicrobiales bacterium]
MNGHAGAMQKLVFHQRRIWRWASFDPPLRHPGLGGCCSRKVLCAQCGTAVGTTNDPVDALLIAWRHRRERRSLSV